MDLIIEFYINYLIKQKQNIKQELYHGPINQVRG